MKNKRTINSGLLLLVLASFMALGFQSCSKYEEGPLISLRSRNERVSNTWKVENYKVDGKDLTSLVTNYKETFTKGGAYSYSWGSINGSGTWAFQNNDMEIKLVGVDNQSSHTLIIQKLEEKSFWYYYMEGNEKHELHLVPY